LRQGLPTRWSPEMRGAIFFLAAVSLLAQDSGRVYVYSRRDTPARSWLAISCDGKSLAGLKQGKFFAVKLPPGGHVFEAEGGVPFSADLRRGEDSYLRLDWNHGLGRAPISVLTQVDMAQARAEIRFLSYVDVKQIHSAIVFKADPTEMVAPQLRTREPR
jgi:hypothetical protein